MKKYPVILLLLLSACTSVPRETPVAAPSGNDEQMNNLAIYAMSLYDTPYRSGGTTRASGFDCSGFVQYVFRNSAGLALPRTSAEMSRVGSAVNADNLKPGDLVFFDTQHSHYSHVGIYVGEYRFLHAPSEGRAIMLSNLHEKYWQKHYEGARRIDPERFTNNQR